MGADRSCECVPFHDARRRALIAPIPGQRSTSNRVCRRRLSAETSESATRFGCSHLLEGAGASSDCDSDTGSLPRLQNYAGDSRKMMELMRRAELTRPRLLSVKESGPARPKGSADSWCDSKRTPSSSAFDHHILSNVSFLTESFVLAGTGTRVVAESLATRAPALWPGAMVPYLSYVYARAQQAVRASSCHSTFPRECWKDSCP